MAKYFNVHFLNEEHEKLYKSYIKKAEHGKPYIYEDTERMSCFYLLALIGAQSATAYNFKAEDFYNFHKNAIIPDSVNRPELTGTTTRIIRLAFTLFNDCPAINADDRSPNRLFGYSPEIDPYLLEAIRIRYSILPLSPADVIQIDEPGDILGHAVDFAVHINEDNKDIADKAINAAVNASRRRKATQSTQEAPTDESESDYPFK